MNTQNKEEKQILCWKSITTGIENRSATPLPKAYALKHVEKLNNDNKGKINYWLEPFVQENNKTKQLSPASH